MAEHACQAEFTQLRDVDSGVIDLESLKAYLIACPKEVRNVSLFVLCLSS